MNKEDTKNLIKRRRFQILINSYIYYKLNDNIVSNNTFDKWVEELYELQFQNPDLSKEVELYDMFKDFTHTSDSLKLPLDNNPGLHSRASHVLRICRENPSKIQDEDYINL